MHVTGPSGGGPGGVGPPPPVCGAVSPRRLLHPGSGGSPGHNVTQEGSRGRGLHGPRRGHQRGQTVPGKGPSYDHRREHSSRYSPQVSCWHTGAGTTPTGSPAPPRTWGGLTPAERTEATRQRASRRLTQECTRRPVRSQTSAYECCISGFLPRGQRSTVAPGQFSDEQKCPKL
jgi:hypothetical protein